MEIREVKCSIESLVGSGNLSVASDTDKGMYNRIKGMEMSLEAHLGMKDEVKSVGVTEEFKKVINTFKVAEGELPAGFRPEYVYGADKSLRVDLARDISYEANGKKRPTNVLFSANTADPYEVKILNHMIASLTTNPALIYDRFINNPKANVNNQFKDRYEVLEELCKIVGPGVDISVEVNDPFAEESVLLEEIARMEEILTPYRLVVKVPHTGPLNRENVKDFLAGNLDVAYNAGPAVDNFGGHNLAHSLAEKGYRVNFTLMFEPYQTALALLSKPYFINTFIEKRYLQSLEMAGMLEKLDMTGDSYYRDKIRDFMVKADMIPAKDADSAKAEKMAREFLAYRELDTPEGCDGLDSVRHSLRVLRQSNLPDTRLILCNMNIPSMYMAVDKMLMEDEFADMTHRVILTCDADYFGQFGSSPYVYTYQRTFLNSVK